MTKEQKRELFRPHRWLLYENGTVVGIYDSHTEAKKIKHKMIVESYKYQLDLEYTLKRID